MRWLEGRPVRRALADVLGLSSETRAESFAKRYKEVLTSWSQSSGVDLAGRLWAKRLKTRSEAPWIQHATEAYRKAMRRILGEG